MKRIITTDFRDHLRDRFIDAQTTPTARLAPTHFLTNEMGVDGDIREELTPTALSKIEFEIPSAKLKGAELLFYVNADTATQDKPMRPLGSVHFIRLGRCCPPTHVISR